MKPINRNRKIGEISNQLKVFTTNTKKKFHIENINWLGKMIKLVFKYTFLSNIGLRNAKNIKLRKATFDFPSLPSEFDGYRIVFISDLHIDCIHSLHKIIEEQVSKLKYDICVLGGDYRFRSRGNPLIAIEKLKQLLPILTKRSPVYGILGNHDQYEIAEFLDENNVCMLINDNFRIKKKVECIYLVGIDDGHYFGAADLPEAEKGIPEKEFKILLSHSPEFYKEAESKGYSLYLAGHTHGGQICLPGGIPIIKEAPVSNNFISGKWSFNALKGYTSKGVGSSMVPVRFFCPPEIVLITLKKAHLTES